MTQASKEGILPEVEALVEEYLDKFDQGDFLPEEGSLSPPVPVKRVSSNHEDETPF